MFCLNLAESSNSQAISPVSRTAARRYHHNDIYSPCIKQFAIPFVLVRRHPLTDHYVERQTIVKQIKQL